MRVDRQVRSPWCDEISAVHLGGHSASATRASVERVGAGKILIGHAVVSLVGQQLRYTLNTAIGVETNAGGTRLE